MNYDTATNDEINIAVQHLRQGPQLWAPLIDYCDSPSDAWPIIMDNNIQIRTKDENLLGAPCARDFGGAHRSYATDNSRLLRAAMIVFLKLKE